MGISRPLAWTLLIAPLVLMATMMVVGALDSAVFHFFIDEDHLIEWLQFFAILIGVDRVRTGGDPGQPARSAPTGGPLRDRRRRGVPGRR